MQEVVDCPEFLVYFPALEKLADRYGLMLIGKQKFANYFKVRKKMNRGSSGFSRDGYGVRLKQHLNAAFSATLIEFITLIDPDLGDQLNADPCGSGSETLLYRKKSLQFYKQKKIQHSYSSFPFLVM
jgi:hypothetical protein